MRFRRLWHTIRLNTIPNSVGRANYLKKHKVFALIGENVSYNPRVVPLYPQLIKIHNNVVIASNVTLVTHDKIDWVLNGIDAGEFKEKVGCIEIMDNVFIGTNTTILPNVKIGNNVIVGGGSLVSKSLEDNGVYVGNPAKRICSFEEYKRKLTAKRKYSTVKNNQLISHEEIIDAWQNFEEVNSERV